MKLTGLHLLLTYQCTYECDHCFTWGSPWQSGTMTLPDLEEFLRQADAVGTVTHIYFEGGEPFLYYPLLVKGIQAAVALGFEVGIVTNGYWANSREDALLWLQPLAGLLQNLSISQDNYHHNDDGESNTGDGSIREHITTAAQQLSIPVGFISIAQPETPETCRVVGQLPEGESAVMYRGRAAQQLAPDAVKHPWSQFDSCPHEDLVEPGRLHLDPLGNLHICQGIVIGNLFQQPLRDICIAYDPHQHPVVGPLLAGGPAALTTHYQLPHAQQYADACHLCNEACRALRTRFPSQLTPDQMYGVPED